MAELGINSETLSRWETHCPALDNEPLDSVLRESARGGWLVKTYAREDAERIKASLAAAATGRWEDSRRTVWLDKRRALRELSQVRGFNWHTLLAWADERTGCVHLAGRPVRAELKKLSKLGAPAMWFVEEDILRCKQALRAVAKGQYGDPSDPYLTLTAAAREFGCTRKTLREWEAKGLLVPRFFPNQRGGPSQDGEKRTYRKAAIQAVLESRSQSFNGSHDSATQAPRVNVKRAAVLLGVSRDTVRQYIRSGTLQCELRKRPRGRREQTVLETDLARLKALRHASENHPPPPAGWKTNTELAARYRIRSASERIAMGKCLARWRDCGYLNAVVVPAPMPNGGAKSAWVYDPQGVEELLGAKSFTEAAAQLPEDQTEEPASSLPPSAGPRVTEPQPEPLPTNSEAAPRKGGRPTSPLTEAVYKFCYEGYTSGEKLAAVRARAEKQFGSHAPKEDSHVRLYARRYAGSHGIPISRAASQETR
jgi:DNA-binding transcriptional MerR regulator